MENIVIPGIEIEGAPLLMSIRDGGEGRYGRQGRRQKLDSKTVRGSGSAAFLCLSGKIFGCKYFMFWLVSCYVEVSWNKSI